MGIGDGVDLGWKIAATVQGWGGPGLVSSYEIERRPVHQAVIEEAVANHALVGGDWLFAELEDDACEGEAMRERLGREVQPTKGREFHTLGTVPGLCYADSPLVARESGPHPPHDGTVYRLSARPGCLAPHAWLPDGRSLYDLFGQGFTLIPDKCADAGAVDAIVAEAGSIGVPLAIICPPGHLCSISQSLDTG